VWPADVIAIKPYCANGTATTPRKPSSVTPTPGSPDKPKLYPDPDIDEAKEKTLCNPSVPLVEYPGDCYKYKECIPMADGTFKYDIKTCGPSMMFNPKTKVTAYIKF
jgi:hypothetical protein